MKAHVDDGSVSYVKESRKAQHSDDIFKYKKKKKRLFV